MDIHDELTVKNKKRGDILYYSISQVANLLGEEDSSIRYYTNVFDNILKIEILNKEFRYTNNDIDKIEFLINLKNKGMTIKEIQKYCEALSLNLEELVEIKENNSLSAKEIITTIVGLENKELNNLKESLSNKIREDNELHIQKIDNLVSEQNNQLELFKEDMLKEIKQYIDYKFDKFNATSNSRHINLIDEIRKFKSVIERAYYVQQEMDTTKERVSFIGKLFGIR